MLALTAHGLLLTATAVGCGLIGGVFFAFSTFIMKALARLPAPQGIAAMQSINLVVINPLFLGALFGTGLLCIAVLITGEGIHRYAALAYLIGTIGVTMFGNVPLNNRLAAINPQAESSRQIWKHYLQHWTPWNHFRAAAALAACAAIVAGKLP